MDVTSLFDHRVGIDDLEGQDLESVFDQIAGALVGAGAISAESRDGLVTGLVERERSGSTALGFGFAIPHVLTDAVDRLWVTVARHSAGLDMGAGDGENTTVLICILAPTTGGDDYLALLRAVAGVLRDGQWRRFIDQAQDASVILETLVEATAV